ncbi:MAG: hypothetical protein R3C28_12860 [Pirellulaceae bacterium]
MPLYPVIQVAFKGQSLQTWIDQEVTQAQTAIEENEPFSQPF